MKKEQGTALVVGGGVGALIAWLLCHGKAGAAEPEDLYCPCDLAHGKFDSIQALMEHIYQEHCFWSGGKVIERLIVIADGDEISVPNPAPPHWNLVQNDDDLGIWEAYGTTGYPRDLFVMADPTRLEEITKVTVYARVSYNGYSVSQCRTQLKTHGAIYEGTEHHFLGNGDDYGIYIYDIYELNPFTGAQWTLQEVIDMQVGIKLMETNLFSGITCHHIYAQLEGFEPATAGIGSPALASRYMPLLPVAW